MKLATKIPATWATLLVASVIGTGISSFTLSQDTLQHFAQQERADHEPFEGRTVAHHDQLECSSGGKIGCLPAARNPEVDGDLVVVISNMLSRRGETLQAEVLTFFHTIRNL